MENYNIDIELIYYLIIVISFRSLFSTDFVKDKNFKFVNFKKFYEDVKVIDSIQLIDKIENAYD